MNKIIGRKIIVIGNDPLKPAVSLLAKTGSALVHAEEGLSSSGHNFDVIEFKERMNDPEVKSWIEEMNKMALISLKR